MPPTFLIWLMVVLFVAAVLPVVVRSWKENRSRNWPRAEVSLETSQIYRLGKGSVLECTFSYRVNGRRYVGRYSREGYKTELTQLAGSLQRGPLFTRYNPSQPDDFFLDPFRDVIGEIGPSNA